jgi:chromosome segregation ATPase
MTSSSKLFFISFQPRELKLSFSSTEQDNDQTLNDSSHQSTSSIGSYELAIIRVNAQCEKLTNQVQELTIKLNESQSAEKHANDEREKYLQIYARTHERFVAFERKQLHQMRRLLTILTSDQRKLLTENATESSQTIIDSQLKESSEDSKTTNNDDDTKLYVARYHKTETDWDDLLSQITQIMDLSQKFCDKCSQQRDENNKLRLLNTQKQDENVKLLFDLSLAKAEFEKEQQNRIQIEKQLADTNQILDQLTNITKKIEKTETDFRDMKSHYENLFGEQVNNIKKLVKEREILHLYIQRLEMENASLVNISNDNETAKLLSHTSQSPTTLEEAWGLIVKLREQIIQQLKMKEKLKNDIQQLQYNHKADLREREQIEQLLNRDLTSAKDEIIVLQSLQTEYERIMSLKKDLEKQLEERKNELKTTKIVANSFTNQLKEKLEQITASKANVDEENASLRVQIQKLKVDLENNELVQHDFVKLSQSLQVC